MRRDLGSPGEAKQHAEREGILMDWGGESQSGLAVTPRTDEYKV